MDDRGHKMMLLCLVTVGIPCVGEEGMKLAPKIHDDLHPPSRYFSYTDSASNPEIHVVKGDDVYPAYIIHYS